MNPDLDRVVEDAKEWQIDCFTTSRCLCVGPCLVQFVNVIATDVAAMVQIDIYDGQNNQGTLKCTVKSQYASPCCSFPRPAYFRRGLYINLTTNATGACVQYLPLKD